MTRSRFAQYQCESALHAESPVPAAHEIHLLNGAVPNSFGYKVCADCLAHYVENVYVAGVVGQHLPFEVRPL